MASSQDTTLQNLIINDVDSEDTLQDMVDNSQIQPNQLYATPDETDGFISLPIGTIFPSAIPQTSSAFHLLDGSTISKTGIYADFATLLQSLVTAGYNISCTQAQFDSDVSTYGQCGKFVIGTDTIRLPKITKFIEGLSNITNIGTSFQAGLPNITGSFANWGEGAASGIAYTTGAFYEISASHFGWGTTTGRDEDNGDVGIDASRSSAIYGRSSTVQPQSTAYPYYIVLANSYKTPVQVDIDQVASDLALKLDKEYASNLVASVKLTSAVSTLTISGLDLEADGGVYDIVFVGGSTNTSSDLYMRTNVSGNNYHNLYSSWYRAQSSGEPNIWNYNNVSQSRWEIARCQEWAVCHITISSGYVNSTNKGVFYTSQGYSWGSPEINIRHAQGLKTDITTFSQLIFELSGGSFNAGTSVKIYKRGTNTPTRS